MTRKEAALGLVKVTHGGTRSFEIEAGGFVLWYQPWARETTEGDWVRLGCGTLLAVQGGMPVWSANVRHPGRLADRLEKVLDDLAQRHGWNDHAAGLDDVSGSDDDPGPPPGRVREPKPGYGSQPN